jgi:DNA polymerase-3 subunit epsilon
LPGGAVLSWADGRLSGIDIATTGGNPEEARIVAVAIVFVGNRPPINNVNLLINPGVPISAEATARHGITTERVRAEGLTPAEALLSVANRLEGAWGSGPVIGFNIAADLTVLDREMRRHLGRGLAVTGPVVDPHVIDHALDHRRGARTLEATCQYYSIRHDAAHSPTQDALAAARLAWRLAKRYPRQVGRLSPAELHRMQITWAQESADLLTQNPHSTDDERSIYGTWPLLPYTVADTRDQTVIEAIHHQVLADWEHELRTDGPQPFRPELHIVNDTPDAHPYFTSIRSLVNHLGHNDAFPIALMGALANVLAADRVVVAWEPVSLALATRDPGSPLPNPAGRERSLMLVDVVSGHLTRLSKHPYTASRAMPDNQRLFAWGKPDVIHHPTEPLPDVIDKVIRMWREPIFRPQSEFTWKTEFRQMGYDITDALRPRARERAATRLHARERAATRLHAWARAATRLRGRSY